MRTEWRHIVVLVLVICAVGAGSFFLTRHLLSSGAAGGPETDLAATARKKALEDTAAAEAADNAKPRYVGTLGDYFFIGSPERGDNVPAELLTEPFPTGSCTGFPDEYIPVPPDDPLYVQLPDALADGTPVTPEGPPQGVSCNGEITSAQQQGNMPNMFGPNAAGLYISKSLLFHSRIVLSPAGSRDRYELATIASKPALVIAALGPAGTTHVKVVIRPFSPGQPGIGISVEGTLSRIQGIALAEQLLGDISQ